MKLSYCLSLAWLSYLSALVNADEDVMFQVPSFDLSDLTSGSRFQDLAASLRSTGLIAVHLDSPEYTQTRQAALNGMCDCMTGESIDRFLLIEGTDSTLLSDRLTTRTTIATATMGVSPLALPLSLRDACGEDTFNAMDALRDHVSFVSSAFVSALDHLLFLNQGPLLQNSDGGSYSTVSSIVKASSNLEHFHVYSKKLGLSIPVDSETSVGRQSRSAEEAVDKALELHTDAGLFLAFVPSEACTSEKSYHQGDASFFVSDNGVIKRAVFPEGSVAIMLGTGAEHWLDQRNIALRATRHAVRMNPGVKRAWYGMMHLVPQNAIIQRNPDKTFEDMKHSMVVSRQRTRRFGDSPEAEMDVSVGCGNEQISVRHGESLDSNVPRTRARLQHVPDASVCNNSTNFYCWMGCLDIPESQSAREYLNEGYSLYCLDPSVLASSGNRVSKAVAPCNVGGVTGGAMNSACLGSWQPTAPGVPAQEVHVESSIDDSDAPFCYGGTSMYMNGFNWVGTTCIIYLFPQWVLSTAGSLTGACIGTLFFGAALEGVIRARLRIVRSMPPGWRRLWISTLAYGAQLTMGYLIMLVVMTYSAPLFLCVVLGLMGGHILWNFQDEMRKKPLDIEGIVPGDILSEGPIKESGYEIPEGSTPCCQNPM